MTLINITDCAAKSVLPQGMVDDVYYHNCWRLKLEGETESICVLLRVYFFLLLVMMFITDITWNLRKLFVRAHSWEVQT